MAKKKVQIVVFTSKPGPKVVLEKVLLLKTNKKRGEFWQNITGSVETDETSFEAALREVKEETGMTLEPDEKLKKLDVEFFFLDREEKKVHEKVYTFLAESENVTIDPNEHNSFLWVEIKSMNKESYRHQSNYAAYIKALEFWRR